MKRALHFSKIFIYIYICMSLVLNQPFSYTEDMDSAYPDDVKEMAEKIVSAYKLCEEGKELYKTKDYEKAKAKFEEAISYDSKNKEAERYLKLCDKQISKTSLKKEEKPRTEKETRRRRVNLQKEKIRLEKNTWGIFGVKKKGLEELLSDIPAKNIPDRKLTLDECIEIALGNSLQIEIAEKQVKLARIRLHEARRKLWPTIKGKWEEESGEIYGKDYYGRKIQVEGMQPIFHGGELFFTASQASANLEIVRNDYDRIKNDIVLKVEKAYFSLDKAIKYLEVQNKLHAEAKTLNDFIARGYQSGAISKLEYLNVSSKYNQMNFQYVSAEEDVSLAKLILQQAINTDEDIDIISVDEPKPREDIRLEDCYNLAYANRPEMKINFLMTEYYLYEKKIAGSRTWPKIDALGMFGYSVEDFSNDEDKVGRKLGPEWYFGFKANLPVFGSTAGYSFTNEKWQPVVSAYQGTNSLTHTATFNILDDLKLYSDIAEADIGLGRAKEEYNKIRQEITLEVKENFFKYKKAALQMSVAKSKVDYQKSQVEFLQAKREMDEAPASNVLEEMVKLGEEEFGLLQAIADYHISIKALNKAIGILGYFDRKDG